MGNPHLSSGHPEAREETGLRAFLGSCERRLRLDAPREMGSLMLDAERMKEEHLLDREE
jgi:hypothetical protein